MMPETKPTDFDHVKEISTGAFASWLALVCNLLPLLSHIPFRLNLNNARERIT